MTPAAHIAAELRRRYPTLTAVHLGGEPPQYASTWYFRFDRRGDEVMLESPNNDYPFSIRASDDEPGDACPVQTFDEAILVLSKFIEDIQGIEEPVSPSQMDK